MAEPAWLPFYGDIPAHIPYPDITLFELATRTAEASPHVPAYEYLGESIPFEAVLIAATSAAKSFAALGIGAGDRVAIALHTTPHVPIMLLALGRIGALASFVHPELESAGLRYFFADFVPDWLVCTDSSLGRLVAAAGPVPVRGVVTCGMHDYGKRRSVRRDRRRLRRTPGTEAVVSTLRRDSASSLEAPPVFAWKSFLQIGRFAELPDIREVHQPTGGSVILYSSGSTGLRRGSLHSDAQLVAAAMQAEVQGPVLSGQTILSCIPVSHGYGLLVGIILPMATGASSSLISGTGRFPDAVRSRRPEYIAGTPSDYATLVRSRRFRKSRLRSLMGAFCGGERLCVSVRDQFERLVRKRGGAVRIREGYGLTETVGPCVTMPEIDDREGSIGIPFPDIRLAVRSIETDGGGELSKDIAPAGETGELLVCGPTVMLWYWNDEERTARNVIHDAEGLRWVRTGDLGHLDGDGFVYFLGRYDAEQPDLGAAMGRIERKLAADERILELVVLRRRDGGFVAHVALSDRALLDESDVPSIPGVDVVVHPRIPRKRTGAPDLGELAIVAARRER